MDESAMLAKDHLVLSLIDAFKKDLAVGGLAPVPAPREPIALTACREEYVLDPDRPLYRRAYAWWKNVQSWSTLRFGNQDGLRPAALRFSEGNLRGELRKTKTTGADKKRGERAFVISQDCYLVHPRWLEVGFDIWKGFLSDRAHLLVMPSDDCEAASHKAVSYTDAAAMSRALNLELPVLNKDAGSEGHLLSPMLVGFWTEHSSRHNVPSWVASTLNVSEDWISLLGGWFRQGTVHRYIETAERRIMLMQSAVASRLRDGRGGRDLVDEDKLRLAIADFLQSKGVSPQQIELQLERLRWFRAPSSVGRADPVSTHMGKGPLLADVEEADGFGTEDIRPELDLDFETPPSESLPAELRGKYAVSIGKKSRHRCLHLLGGCHRVPGLHYQDFEVFDTRPTEDQYHGVCGQCWRRDKDAAADAEDDTGSTSSSASEDEV